MKIENLSLKDLKLIHPVVFSDERGYFFEAFHHLKFAENLINLTIVQINQSGSQKGVLRGLHYQVAQPQGKLVRAITGKIFDVAVDLRKSSLTYGQWAGVYLSSDEKCQLWIPPGFAHGFIVMSDWAEVEYGTTDYYSPENERTILWNDSSLAIEWPLALIGMPILSSKDSKGASFIDAEKFE